MLSRETLATNLAGLRGQLEKFLDFSGPRGAVLVDNAEWLDRMPLIDFLRDVGKHFSVNVMLARETVKRRLESDGISYTEFSYLLLQSNDFVELNRRHGATLPQPLQAGAWPSHAWTNHCSPCANRSSVGRGGQRSAWPTSQMS